MKIVSVVGSGSGCGKTTVVCALLRAIPGLGAVKISPRKHPLRVEWGAGEAGKDTDLFVRSGAARVARIVGPREAVGQAWESIKNEFQQLAGVVIEGSRGIDLPGEKLRLFVGGKKWQETLNSKNRELAAESAMIIEFLPHYFTKNMPESGFLTHKVKYSPGRICPSHNIEPLPIDLFGAVRTFLGHEFGG